MIALFLMLALSLQDAARALAVHPAFTARFEQTLVTSTGDTINDKGEVRFAWGKGLRFDYAGKEKKSFAFVPDGSYTRAGDGSWDFQPWDETAADLDPFLFLLNGRVPEAVTWSVGSIGGLTVIESRAPAFSLQMDPKTGWPRRLKITQDDGSVNTLEFSGHRAGAEGILP